MFLIVSYNQQNENIIFLLFTVSLVVINNISLSNNLIPAMVTISSDNLIYRIGRS